MKFLVDVNVLSEAMKPIPDEKAVAWLYANEGSLVIDPVVLGEMVNPVTLLQCL